MEKMIDDLEHGVDSRVHEQEIGLKKDNKMLLFWPGDVKSYYGAVLKKFPQHHSLIDKALNNIKGYKWYDDEEKNKAMIKRMKEKEESLQKYAKRVENVPFE